MAIRAMTNHTTCTDRQQNTPKVATSPCHFLPLLPPIIPNIKLPAPANPLQFSLRPRSAFITQSKSGKNGNVDWRGQHCHLEPASLNPRPAWPDVAAAGHPGTNVFAGHPRRRRSGHSCPAVRAPAMYGHDPIPLCGKLQGGAAPAPTHKSATSQHARQRIGGTMMDFWDAFYGPNAG